MSARFSEAAVRRMAAAVRDGAQVEDIAREHQVSSRTVYRALERLRIADGIEKTTARPNTEAPNDQW